MHNNFQRGAGLLPAIGLLALIIVVAGGAYYYMRAERTNGTQATSTPQNSTLETYANSEFGVTFQYPNTYVLTASDQPGSGMRRHHAVVLMDREAAANIPVGGEGPPTINVDFFQNNLDDLTAEEWVLNSNASNYKLPPDEEMEQITLSGQPAYSYRWEGLYNGESIVFAHGDYIVMVSVSYFTPTDQIRSDFDTVINSLRAN